MLLLSSLPDHPGERRVAERGPSRAARALREAAAAQGGAGADQEARGTDASANDRRRHGDRRRALLPGRSHGEQRRLGGAAARRDPQEPEDRDPAERRPDRAVDHRVRRRIRHWIRTSRRILLGSQVRRCCYYATFNAMVATTIRHIRWPFDGRPPCAGSRVVRTKNRPAPFPGRKSYKATRLCLFLCLSLDFLSVSVVLLTRAIFALCYSVFYLCVLSFGCSC